MCEVERCLKEISSNEDCEREIHVLRLSITSLVKQRKEFFNKIETNHCSKIFKILNHFNLKFELFSNLVEDNFLVSATQNPEISEFQFL